MSENSCFRDLSAQVSQIPFLNLFDRFTAYYNCMTENVRKLISPPFQCTSITNRVLSLINLFAAYYNCMTWNLRKLLFFAISVHKYHKSLFLPYLTVSRLITTVWPEMSENSILRDFSAQVSQIVFLANLRILRLFYNCMTWNVRKLIFARFQCRSITNRFHWLFDPFTAYYNCITWSVRKLLSLRFEWASITNRFLGFLTILRLFYNYMTWNVRKLIAPRSQCTSIIKRFLRLFDRFTAYYNCMSWTFRKVVSQRLQCTSIVQIVFSSYLTVLQLITIVWPEMSENSYLREFSAQVSQIVFLAYWTVLRLITTVRQEKSENS